MRSLLFGILLPETTVLESEPPGAGTKIVPPVKEALPPVIGIISLFWA
jgi:hypothetical protein